MRTRHVARRRLPTSANRNNSVGRGKKKTGKKKKRKRKKGGVRSSTFSLDSTKIGPLVFVGARGKVLQRDESFTWVRESGVFAKLREVGFSPIWVSLNLRAI